MEPVGTIVINARIVTMDGATPYAQALAVRDGRVTALGSNEEIRELADRSTKVIDAGGRLVLPGFQDTHIHLQDSGQDYSQNADLSSARTQDDIVRILSAFAKTHDRAWVNGTGWYSGIFHTDNLDRHLIDRAVPNRPCLIVASDGHNACLNSAGCAAIGLAADTPDPPNGHFVRDAKGEPTGMLYENALMWAEARMPTPSDADFADGVKWAQALAHRHGITGILDARVEERHVRVYRSLEAADALTLRVAATALVNAHDTTWGAVERLSDLRAGNSGGRFKVHSAKFFLDGVVENRTAAMIVPYSDAEGGNAPLMFTPDQITQMFTAFDAARFQIHVHAIGDLAVRAALDGVEAARAANGDWPSLHQIAHIQFIDPADLPRFRKLGVMANVQPLWARSEPSVTDIAVPMVGNDRSHWIYAFRSLLDAGAAMALSSDWGVSTLNPFEIIETAVTRQPPAASARVPPFLPDERITRAEAVAGYTTQAAAAAWRSSDTGTLGIGKHADLIVLDDDIFTCPTHEIGSTKVVTTMVGGDVVYERA
ncbi:N-substituted formamide deformylase [Defluviimonas aquaemixtae]|uniref:N-substituted formamide deformylase n=1 Tax=Albidovulum aquaemixtae TaxID=1542388 RepID=A0A2R8B3T9_9RHOB|nr:amidohydrolase [Defluviimonas aquaemixtae]SPH17255.1 N-substituted formamide deformylase [Defluviimonas aquaemixtae]